MNTVRTKTGMNLCFGGFLARGGDFWRFASLDYINVKKEKVQFD